VTPLFDLTYATSTPEVVAILWHGAAQTIPFLIAIVGGLALRWWQLRGRMRRDLDELVRENRRLRDVNQECVTAASRPLSERIHDERAAGHIDPEFLRPR